MQQVYDFIGEALPFRYDNEGKDMHLSAVYQRGQSYSGTV